MNTHRHVAHRLQTYRSNPLASGINFTPAMLQGTKSSSKRITRGGKEVIGFKGTLHKSLSKHITSGGKAVIGFKGSTTIGGKRGTGGRRATNTWPRPVQYVPDHQREAALAKYAAAEKKYVNANKAKGRVSKLSREAAVHRGLPVPTRQDVQDSINFDVYEALCEALGVPVGTFVDTNVWNKAKNGLRNSGMTRDQLNAEYARLNIRGDAKESYYGSRDLAYKNSNSRFFNVPYKDVLKGSVLTALGVIPLNNRNMSEVLRELEGQSNQPLILDPEPESPEPTTESAEGDGKKKALIIGGSILALALIGGGVFLATRKK